MSPDTMPFRAQLAMVRQSRVLIGFHGAAMAHLLFMHPDASVLELTLPRFAGRTNYVAMARGTGVTFLMHALDARSEEGDTEVVTVSPSDLLPLLEYLAPRE
eukprot:m.139930 g.139930  ORF g.139930 m.139930 type:complete len:102 (+) comp14942_c2_seq9:186-491(+)